MTLAIPHDAVAFQVFLVEAGRLLRLPDVDSFAPQKAVSQLVCWRPILIVRTRLPGLVLAGTGLVVQLCEVYRAEDPVGTARAIDHKPSGFRVWFDEYIDNVEVFICNHKLLPTGPLVVGIFNGFCLVHHVGLHNKSTVVSILIDPSAFLHFRPCQASITGQVRVGDGSAKAQGVAHVSRTHQDADGIAVRVNRGEGGHLCEGMQLQIALGFLLAILEARRGRRNILPAATFVK
mmetsp:Transcript_42793/g.91801  ORF Transcript_42793/g.91801 Transcript_42793/m.91801 type:complete len:234 (+) Transcript_42793:857-1558(+)